MIVRDLLIEALSRAGDIRRGQKSVSQTELDDAKTQFDSALRKYSDNNMITAFQKILDFQPTKTETTIGRVQWALVNGKEPDNCYVVDTKPTDSGWTEDDLGKTFYCLDTRKIWRVTLSSGYEVTGKMHCRNTMDTNCRTKTSVEFEGGTLSTTQGDYLDLTPTGTAGDNGDLNVWALYDSCPDVGDTVTDTGIEYTFTEKTIHFQLTEFTSVKSSILAFEPDINCEDMQRCMHVMYLSPTSLWAKLRYVPLYQFFTDIDYEIYCDQPIGLGKIKLYLPYQMIGTYLSGDNVIGRQIKMVYNANMKFGLDDYIDLPELHLELLTVAVEVALLSHDGDANPQVLQLAQQELKDIEDNIKSTTISNRVIQRDDPDIRESLDSLITGSFLRRR